MGLRILATMILFIMSWTALTAQGRIRGNVLDAGDLRPLEGVSVAAVHLPDSTVVAVTLSDKEGRFEISEAEGDISLRFAKAGWETLFVVPEEEVITVEFQKSDVALPELTVKATKANMKGSPGKFVFEPGDLSKYVKDALAILDHVPLLESPTNIFSKIGEATIYINGEAPAMGQTAILDKLKTLPANKIRKVELIMNPGAEYDRETLQGGIINIVLEDDMIGWNAFTRFSTDYRERRFSNFSPYAMWYYQNHSLLLSASLSYGYSDRFKSESGTLSDEETGLTRDITRENRGRTHSMSARVTGEYKVGRNAFSLSAWLAGSDSRLRDIVDEIQYRKGESDMELTSRMENRDPWRPTFGVAARFTRWLDNGRSWKLNVSALMAQNSRKTLNTLDVFRTETGDVVPTELMDQSYDYREYGRGISVKLNKRFADRSSLSVQTQFSSEGADRTYTGMGDGYVFDRRLLAEDVSLSYERDLTGFLSMRAGVREQYFARKIRGEENDGWHDSHFLLWLPNVSLSFRFGGGRHNVNADWYAYPFHPFDTQLNPHRIWSTATSYDIGNPDMPITTDQHVSLQYGFLNSYFISVEYRTGKHCNHDYIYLDPEGNKVSTYLMDERENNMEVNLNYNRHFFNYRWQLSANANMLWRNSMTPPGPLRMSNHSLNYRFTLMSRVTISQRYGIVASGRYVWSSGDRELTRRVSGLHSIYVSLRKDLWKDADIEASVLVPLNRTYTTLTDATGLSDTTISKFSRDISASIGFSWFFGKSSIERVENISL